MKRKIIITILLFIFSFLYLKSTSSYIRENDSLMKIIKNKQNIYNITPIDAIITSNTMIPGICGKNINLIKSYNNMKSINEFRESLIIYDEIKPSKSINGIYNKVIISGNPNINKISILTTLDNKYCYTENLCIKKECIRDNKYTILIYKITNNHLTKIKDLVKNGIIFYIESLDNLDLIIKYLKSNNYEIVSIDKLIKE